MCIFITQDDSRNQLLSGIWFKPETGVVHAIKVTNIAVGRSEGER